MVYYSGYAVCIGVVYNSGVVVYYSGYGVCYSGGVVYYKCSALHCTTSSTVFSEDVVITMAWCITMVVWYITVVVWYVTVAVWYITVAMWYITVEAWYVTVEVWYITVAVWCTGRSVAQCGVDTDLSWSCRWSPLVRWLLPGWAAVPTRAPATPAAELTGRRQRRSPTGQQRPSDPTSGHYRRRPLQSTDGPRRRPHPQTDATAGRQTR